MDDVPMPIQGARVKPTGVQPETSKLARAKRQHAIVGDPDDLVGPGRDLQTRLESEWTKDWDSL
jgi:hypothetical protein